MDYKIVVFGNCAVGKSALIIQFIQNHFIDAYDTTIEDSYRKLYKSDGRKRFLDITDTSGAEEFATMRDLYFRNGEGFILVFSVTSRKSFDGLATFYQSIMEAKQKQKVPLVIVGNKIDIDTERQISKEEGEELAEAMNCPYIEISTKTRINVELTFDTLVQQIDLERPVEKKSKIFNLFKRH